MKFNPNNLANQSLRAARVRLALVSCIGALFLNLLAGAVHAAPLKDEDLKDRIEPLPARLGGVNVEEKFGEEIPTELRFKDSSGQTVRLGDFFDGKRPVILTFNYSDCPMLCSLQLSRFVAGLRLVARPLEQEFQIVTLSIDPNETTERARETESRYHKDYGRPGAKGWHFLTGGEGDTRAVAEAVGFSYQFNEKRKEWLHPAAIMVMTPDGKLARYLYGVEFHPDTLDLALVEASEGKIGSTLDRLILYCFHYDETEGRYAPVAMNIMRLGAGFAALGLAFFLTIYWIAERRQRRISRASTES